jgi:hypothetical protein
MDIKKPRLSRDYLVAGSGVEPESACGGYESCASYNVRFNKYGHKKAPAKPGLLGSGIGS